MNSIIEILTSDQSGKIIKNITAATIFFVPLGIIIRTVYTSFAYDSFDILFKSKEKRNLITHTIGLTKTILLTLYISFLFLLIGLGLFQFKWLVIIFLFLFLIVFILFLLWVIYYFILYPIPILKRFFDNRIDINYKLVNTLVICIFVSLLEILSCIIFLELLGYKNNEFHLNENSIGMLGWLITFSLLFVLIIKNNLPNKKINYQLIGTYNNRFPCELFLDTIIDHNTHILTSNNGNYKAIKYNSYGNNGSYTIELYRKVE